jgi:hypothetical protein
MPPSAVRSIRDLIFWQYAKIISSESAGAGKNLTLDHILPRSRGRTETVERR